MSQSVKDRLRSLIPPITEVSPEVRKLLNIAPNQSVAAMGLLMYGVAEIDSKGGFFGGSQRRKVVIVCTYTSIYICDAKKGTAITLFPHKDVSNVQMMSQPPPNEVPGAGEFAAHMASPATSVLVQNTDMSFVAIHFPNQLKGGRVGCTGAELVQLVQKIHDETHKILEELGEAESSPPLNIEMRFDNKPSDCIKVLRKQASKAREAAKSKEGLKSPRQKLEESVKQLRKGGAKSPDDDEENESPSNHRFGSEDSAFDDDNLANTSPELCGSLQIAPDSVGLEDSPETTPRNRAHSGPTDDAYVDPNTIVTHSDPSALGDPTVLNVADPYADTSDVYGLGTRAAYAGIPTHLFEGKDVLPKVPVTAEDKEREALEAFYKAQAEDDERKKQKELRKLTKAIAAAAEGLAKCEAEEERKRKKIQKRRIKGVNRRYEKLDMLLHGEIEDLDMALAEMRAEEQAEEVEEDQIERQVERGEPMEQMKATDDGSINGETLVDYSPPEPIRDGSEAASIPPIVREAILASSPPATQSTTFAAGSGAADRRASLASLTRQPSHQGESVGRTQSIRSQASGHQSYTEYANLGLPPPQPASRSGSIQMNSVPDSVSHVLQAYGLETTDASTAPYDPYAHTVGSSSPSNDQPLVTKVRTAQSEHKRAGGNVKVDSSFFHIESTPLNVYHQPLSLGQYGGGHIQGTSSASAISNPNQYSPKPSSRGEGASLAATVGNYGTPASAPRSHFVVKSENDSNVTAMEVRLESAVEEIRKLREEVQIISAERNEALRMLGQYISTEAQTAGMGTYRTTQPLASVITKQTIGVQVNDGMDILEAEALATARHRGISGTEYYPPDDYQHGERAGTKAYNGLDMRHESPAPTVYERLEEQRRLTGLLSDRCLMLHRAMEREKEAAQIHLKQQLLAQQAQYEALLLQQRDALRSERNTLLASSFTRPVNATEQQPNGTLHLSQEPSAAYVPYATYYNSSSNITPRRTPNAEIAGSSSRNTDRLSDAAFLGKVGSALGVAGSALQRGNASTISDGLRGPTPVNAISHHSVAANIQGMRSLPGSARPGAGYAERQREMSMDV